MKALMIFTNSEKGSSVPLHASESSLADSVSNHFPPELIPVLGCGRCTEVNHGLVGRFSALCVRPTEQWRAKEDLPGIYRNLLRYVDELVSPILGFLTRMGKKGRDRRYSRGSKTPGLGGQVVKGLKRLSMSIRIMGIGAIVMALMMVGVIILAIDVSDMVRVIEAQDRSQEAVRLAGSLLTDVIDMETGLRGFVITGKQEFLEPFYQGRSSFPLSSTLLRAALNDRPDQVARVDSVIELVQAWLNRVADPEIELRMRGEKVDPLASAELGKGLIDQIRSRLNGVQNTENKLMQAASYQERVRTDRALLETLTVGVVTAIIGLLFSLILTRSITRPIGALVTATRMIAEQGPGLQLPVSSGDEVGRLTEAFNRMSRDLAAKKAEVTAQNERLQAQQEELATQNEELQAQQQELMHLVSQLELEKSRLERMIDFAEAVTLNATNIRQLGDRVLAGLMASGSAQVGAIVLTQPGEPAQVLSGSGLTEEALAAGAASSKGLVGRALAEQRCILTSYPAGELLRPVYHTQLPVQHEIYLPLTYAGEPLGVAVLGRTGAVAFDDETRRVLELIALQAAAAISNSLSFERLASAYGNLDAILRATSEGIRLIDDSGRDVIANDQFWKLLGSGSGTSLPAEAETAAARAAEDPSRSVSETFAIRRPEPAVLQQFSAPAFDRQGRRIGRVFVLRDVTRETEVDRMKNEFVSTVSHELRTPLTSIRGALGLLASGLMGTLSEKGQHMLDIAAKNTDRLVRLINDILDIERMESGKVTLQKRLCDAAQLVSQAAEGIQPVADKARVTLEVSPVPSRVWADPDRIIQTLTNILGNAIKFSPPGTKVWLRAERQGDQVLFQVKDQGRGIPADKLESIFKPFEQVDASDSRKKGGSGLGLAICRSIVQQHGGRIWAESALGTGSTFFFTLPALKDEESEVHTDPSVEGRMDPLSDTPAGDRTIVPSERTILVCDDDPSVRTVMQTILEQRGYKVVTVASGQEAVEQAAIRRPAVILLDLIMPGMNGWEAITALKARADTRNIPIIIMSALRPEDGESQPPDAVDWVHKPLDECSLLPALEKALGSQARSATVLVVEDDNDLASLLITIFQRHGIKAIHAQTGREAVRLSQSLVPDLLVLDLTLPDGDGFSVVDWLRQHNRLSQVPLIVYTAKDLDDVDRDRLRLGPTIFLTKSRITPEEFEERIMGLLSRIFPGDRGEKSSGN